MLTAFNIVLAAADPPRRPDRSLAAPRRLGGGRRDLRRRVDRLRSVRDGAGADRAPGSHRQPAAPSPSPARSSSSPASAAAISSPRRSGAPRGRSASRSGPRSAACSPSSSTGSRSSSCRCRSCCWSRSRRPIRPAAAEPGPGGPLDLRPEVGLGLLSAGLTGALFLLVILLTEGWGLSPIAAAATVSAIPLATLAARWIAHRAGPPASAALAGGIAVAGGLAALGVLPGASWALTLQPQLLIGIGLALALPVLTIAALGGRDPDGSRAVGDDRRPPRRNRRRDPHPRPAALGPADREADRGDRRRHGGAARRAAPGRHEGLARDGARRADRRRRRQAPGDRPRLRLGHARPRRRGGLRDSSRPTSRTSSSGRRRARSAWPFLAAALLAALALIPIAAARDPDRRHPMGDRNRAPLIALAASIGLIAVYVAFGGGTYTPAATADPCETRDAGRTRRARRLRGHRALGARRRRLRAPRQPRGADARARRRAGDRRVRGRPRHRLRAVDDAVRAGLERAVDDAAAAGKIDGVEETILRQVARYAPVGPAIDGLQALSDDDSVQGLIEQLGGLTTRRPGPRRTRTSDLDQLIPAAVAGTKKAAPDCLRAALIVSVRTGGDLLSQAVSHQVPSALRGLTALFGMGRGVSPSLLPPKSVGPAEACRPPLPAMRPASPSGEA